MAKIVKVLRVTAKQEGFRRAGMEFGTVQKDLPLDTVSADTQALLRSDPSLVAHEVVLVMDESGHTAEVSADRIEALLKIEEEYQKLLGLREAATPAKPKTGK